MGWTGAGASGANEERTITHGYLIGVVRDERIAAIELGWPAGEPKIQPDVGDHAGQRWTTPVGPGFFMVAVSEQVPIAANPTYRFLDTTGGIVHETDGQH